MGTRVWVFVFAISFSGILQATDWYSTVAGSYNKGGVPDAKHLAAGQAWTGKCSASNDKENRSFSILYIYVDKDPFSGSTFQMVPLFNADETIALGAPQYRAIHLANHREMMGKTVRVSASEKAWSMELSRKFGHSQIYLKEGKDEKGKPVFILRTALEGPDERESKLYCYYYAPLKQLLTQED